MSLTAHQLRPGMYIEYEAKLWLCLEAVHKTPGNKRGFVQAKLRNVMDGNQKEFKFSSSEALERATLKARTMQYLYEDSGVFHFMDQASFEQFELAGEVIGNYSVYLTPDIQVDVTFHDDKAIGIKLPSSLEFDVVEAEPNMKSATASAQFKNAKIENGLEVKVPQFVEVGDRIKINPETGEYIERA